jgi:stage IV sporulation protein FB
MRDPFSWSFAVGRLFGITVRIHVLFPLVCLGLILRTTGKDFWPGTWIDATVLMGLLFLVVLLHEFGHCFAARNVGGEASEVLLWPLGGQGELYHGGRRTFG